MRSMVQVPQVVCSELLQPCGHDLPSAWLMAIVEISILVLGLVRGIYEALAPLGLPEAIGEVDRA